LRAADRCATTLYFGNKTYLLEGPGGNVTVAVGTDGIIMVDSQFAPMHDKLKAAIEKISPLPIKYLINTHYQGDHTGGDAAFHKDGIVDVVEDRLPANAPNGLTGAKMPAQPADGLPTDTYPAAAPASRASVMRFIVFSVGDLITRVATRVLMTPAKKRTSIVIIAPADGIKAAKLSKRRLRYISVLWASLSQATACLYATSRPGGGRELQ
jgi:glyoxylase-like metal-dependent hydrolase (beta-lactamase superfamily II)